MQRKNHIYIILIISFFSLLGQKNVNAQFYEYEIKAAYIFNFAKFIDWNESISKSDTLTLGIYKNDPFGIILEKTMLGRKANGKNWSIIRIDNLEEIDQCQILFISDISKYDYLILLSEIENKPILTIGDELEGFCEHGGMVNFTAQHSKNQFEINNEVAFKNGLTISPKLLLLAKIVSGNEDEF